MVNRLLDVLLSLAGLVLVLPIMELIAVAIKLESPGLVLFRQQRTGEHGRVFVLNTFRSTYLAAESHGSMGATAQDARVTRVGRWLRETQADKLPQLWNVLVGDISFFGRGHQGR